MVSNEHIWMWMPLYVCGRRFGKKNDDECFTSYWWSQRTNMWTNKAYTLKDRETKKRTIQNASSFSKLITHRARSQYSIWKSGCVLHHNNSGAAKCAQHVKMLFLFAAAAARIRVKFSRRWNSNWSDHFFFDEVTNALPFFLKFSQLTHSEWVDDDLWVRLKRFVTNSHRAFNCILNRCVELAIQFPVNIPNDNSVRAVS